MNLELGRWLDSEAYAQQKSVINREVNSILSTGALHAHISFRSPNRTMKVDRSVFKQSATEKGQAYTAKMRHKKYLREHGVDPNKHLNTPANALVSPIRITK